MTALNNRYEFVLLFDIKDGNPNGDPDAGNMPRLDPETNQGLVTDVCLKRKIRNYVELTQGDNAGYAIYMQEKAVLNNQNKLAYEAQGLKHVAKKLPNKAEQAQSLTKFMCDQFFDVRTFGAVMSTEVNTGTVRGAVQIAFARSIDPVFPQEISITRMAVTNEKDVEKERTMGRKHIIPYGLYRVHGFISAALAEKTGFSEEDLELLWKSLTEMFEHDHSAARGEMASQKLIIFKHADKLGSAPAHKLFDLIKVTAKNPDVPARHFSDYNVEINPENVSINGVEIIDYANV
ncbi:type I-C CRISPR-associated protein Cas7/Csd2 [Methyloprofundus sedimenti]|uniref:Type I-C CRISPR-associated protein Cas7/Csd2 n=1 Tax=Methyloprofundus sedimenti TaxID=1420851 RepID=A0A1V8M7H7_9GAMM|nr:type I-C CRISPR-associated protein Cas7/Csd2 [Methyloprofundus sedimenti]OQK17507.1 type I-C CRISPR-associated protein Cas7/Csd2 [Methyloprofundus sedimenti]